VLGRKDGFFQKSASFFDAISQDPILNKVKLIAEPWDIGTYQIGNFVYLIQPKASFCHFLSLNSLRIRMGWLRGTEEYFLVCLKLSKYKRHKSYLSESVQLKKKNVWFRKRKLQERV